MEYLTRLLDWAKGFRTVAVNTALMVFGFLGSTGLLAVLPMKYVFVILIVVGAVNIALRFVTDTSIFQKE